MYSLPLKTSFYGNKDFIKNIGLSLYSKNTNSYIISGPRGVGKANFVYKLSKFILCHYEESSKSDLKNKIKETDFFSLYDKCKSQYLFENNTHPDFLKLELDLNSNEKKIPIDKVRKLNSFFQSTFSISKVKVAVINTIDDLSINSMNLLLKTIEELSKSSYIFLISHNSINILKTISSRCNQYRINLLGNEEFNIFLNENLKKTTLDERYFINEISMGSPGLALSLHNKEVFGFYLNLTNDLLKKSNYFRLSSSILNLVSVKNKESGFYIFIIRLIISNLIKKTSFFLLQNEYLETSLSNEKELIEIIIKNNNLAKILSLHSKFVKDMHSASFLNISETDIIDNLFKDLFQN